ncbi:hypothetical protein VNI00_010567 [Paramarasmius palmivorus]|uniref:Uncharacterized protein n=1 Tax=Paramarasmius palmivorus TaxID=297713 RepID=A0AAW0CK45_9AGAR
MAGKMVRSEAQPLEFLQAVSDEFLKSRPNTGNVADRYEFTNIAGVFNFVNDEGLKVQIVAAEREAIEVIMGFYSTLVLNVGTATKVVSLYPQTSFVEKRALYLKHGTRAVQDARIKYESRGWGSLDMLSASEYLADSELSSKPRWYGDRHCWTVVLSPLPGIPNASRAYGSLRVTSWRLFSGSPGSVTLPISVVDRADLRDSLFVLGEAQVALKWHPCFQRVSVTVPYPGAISLPYVAENSDGVHGEDGFGEDQSVTLEVEEESGGASGGSGNGDLDTSEDSSSLHSSGDGFSSDWEGLTVWSYTNGIWGCGHRELRPPASFDSVVLEYLNGLYPLVDEVYQRGRVVNLLRESFNSLRDVYPDINRRIGWPSAFVVANILQCVDDVCWSILCDDEDIDLDISFTFDPACKEIHTNCNIYVPSDKFNEAKDGVADWVVSTDEWEEARLKVKLLAVQ